MLCRYDDILTAVQKQYPDADRPEGEMPTFQLPPGFEGALKEDCTEKLGRLEDLHYRSDVLDRVAKLLNEPGTGLGLVVETLAHDPALAAATLRSANSAVYGMASQVDGLSLVVTLLGREGLAALVAKCKKVNVVPQGNLSPLYERALNVAKNAAILARATGRVGRETAYTAGLLHSVGSFALEAASPQRYGKMKTTRQPPRWPRRRKRPLDWATRKRGNSCSSAGAIRKPCNWAWGNISPATAHKSTRRFPAGAGGNGGEPRKGLGNGGRKTRCRGARTA